jgi:hypothetical protein
MFRPTYALITELAILALAIGCSTSANYPVLPGSPELMANKSVSGNPAQTHLWGYYNVYINPATQEAEVSVNRNAMFTANVVTFIKSNPANLAVKVNGVENGGAIRICGTCQLGRA